VSSYILIDGWKSNIRFSSAHIIPEYEKCGRLHGHSYGVHIKIKGKPDNKGIIMDFSLVKDILREIINNLDHKILVPKNGKSITIKQMKDQIEIILLDKRYVFPVSDCVLLPIESTSAENLASYILEKFIDRISPNNEIEEIEIGVDEGYGQGARISKALIKR
jgi:6-pyruvoyltetrahydropterin/6-carboxytetrahydropterin synthase